MCTDWKDDQITYLNNKLEMASSQAGNCLRRYDALSTLLEQYAGRSLSHDEKMDLLRQLIAQPKSQ